MRDAFEIHHTQRICARMAVKIFKALIDLRCEHRLFLITQQRHHIRMLSNGIRQVAVAGCHRAQAECINVQTAAKHIDLGTNLPLRSPLASYG